MNKKILIVDDSSIDLHQGQRALISAGIDNEVLVAHDGKEALRLLMSDPDIGIVLLDLKMPPPDGLHVLEFIRSEPKRKNTKVVAVTGAITEQQKEALQTMGVNEILIKDFFFRDLHPILLRMECTLTINFK